MFSVYISQTAGLCFTMIRWRDIGRSKVLHNVYILLRVFLSALLLDKLGEFTTEFFIPKKVVKFIHI